jgi:hypothetical protein
MCFEINRAGGWALYSRRVVDYKQVLLMFCWQAMIRHRPHRCVSVACTAIGWHQRVLHNASSGWDIGLHMTSPGIDKLYMRGCGARVQWKAGAAVAPCQGLK